MMKLTLMTRFFESVTSEWHSPIASTIAALWLRPEADVRVWRASANFVCRARCGENLYYLRFNHASERSVERVTAELDFVNALAQAGVKVARPVASRADHLVEYASTALGPMVAVLFEALPGEQRESGVLSPDDFEAWGQALGRIHSCALSYCRPGRPAWQDHLTLIRGIIPESDANADAWREMATVESILSRLPISPDCFGLIHYDFEQDNLTWQGKQIGAFDFDDFAYYWYAADIAYALRDLFDDHLHKLDLHHPALQSFVAGYRMVRPLAAEELASLPVFVRLHNLVGIARMMHSLEGYAAASGHAPQWCVDLSARLTQRLALLRADFRDHPLDRLSLDL